MKPIDAAPQVSFVVHLVYRHCGPVAQLGERLVRNEEASGSIPLRSTIFQRLTSRFFAITFHYVPIQLMAALLAASTFESFSSTISIIWATARL